MGVIQGTQRFPEVPAETIVQGVLRYTPWVQQLMEIVTPAREARSELRPADRVLAGAPAQGTAGICWLPEGQFQEANLKDGTASKSPVSFSTAQHGSLHGRHHSFLALREGREERTQLPSLMTSARIQSGPGSEIGLYKFGPTLNRWEKEDTMTTTIV